MLSVLLPPPRGAVCCCPAAERGASRCRNDTGRWPPLWVGLGEGHQLVCQSHHLATCRCIGHWSDRCGLPRPHGSRKCRPRNSPPPRPPAVAGEDTGTACDAGLVVPEAAPPSVARTPAPHVCPVCADAGSASRRPTVPPRRPLPGPASRRLTRSHRCAHPMIAGKGPRSSTGSVTARWGASRAEPMGDAAGPGTAASSPRPVSARAVNAVGTQEAGWLQLCSQSRPGMSVQAVIGAHGPQSRHLPHRRRPRHDHRRFRDLHPHARPGPALAVDDSPA